MSPISQPLLLIVCLSMVGGTNASEIKRVRTCEGYNVKLWTQIRGASVHITMECPYTNYYEVSPGKYNERFIFDNGTITLKDARTNDSRCVMNIKKGNSEYPAVHVNVSTQELCPVYDDIISFEFDILENLTLRKRKHRKDVSVDVDINSTLTFQLGMERSTPPLSCRIQDGNRESYKKEGLPRRFSTCSHNISFNDTGEREIYLYKCFGDTCGHHTCTVNVKGLPPALHIVEDRSMIDNEENDDEMLPQIYRMFIIITTVGVWILVISFVAILVILIIKYMVKIYRSPRQKEGDTHDSRRGHTENPSVNCGDHMKPPEKPDEQLQENIAHPIQPIENTVEEPTCVDNATALTTIPANSKFDKTENHSAHGGHHVILPMKSDEQSQEKTVLAMQPVDDINEELGEGNMESRECDTLL